MKPILLVVMDGIGFSKTGIGDAITEAHTPTLDKLMAECPMVRLKAHGSAVGLPSDDDMGNSEVGHNALGCGQIYSQGAKLVNESIESGKIFDSEAWKKASGNCIENGSTMHFLGLLSDGNVHSNISHLFAMLEAAKKEGVKSARVHVLLDGRDVPATSALTYIDALEAKLAELNDDSFCAKIASGGGRMVITMDRYQADWNMVKRGWDTHVLGKGRQFASATEAIETLRNETGAIDQDLPPFVIAENGTPAGTIEDNDSVIFFNFRGDRAIEISMAFDDEEFNYFDRERRPNVVYAGMLQYDGDLKLPKLYLVSPPEIRNTLSELLIANGISQYAVSETQKY
ncbi:MAG: 2,3-bisphosphoglycerate-independent phosphoglycerate mutase, partial [Clostridia bacterium]|nr:2,3-bisphosphoglycerate-independent phosphoglycerate mutase [Clostridia bacterium]